MEGSSEWPRELDGRVRTNRLGDGPPTLLALRAVSAITLLPRSLAGLGGILHGAIGVRYWEWP